MQPTIYLGILLAAIGLILCSRRRVKYGWWFFAFCQLFQATSVGTVLGGSTLGVPLMGFIVLFVTANLSVAFADGEVTRRTLQTHALAFAIIAYAAIITFFGPRLFAGQIDLIGMRPVLVDDRGLAMPTPLKPDSANLIHTTYMTTSYLAAFSVSLLFARKLPAREFANAMIALAFVHALLGLIDWVGLQLGQGRVLNFLRNASYTMVDQSLGNLKRLSGAQTEPSTFASMGVPFAIFALEYWARTRRLLAGAAGVFCCVMILASTSSTGIVCLAGYAAATIPRILLARGGFNRKAIGVAVVLAAVLGVVAVAAASPATFAGWRDYLLMMTVEKGESDSGIERASWAAQGWHAFVVSHGLGTGVGTFRSSSLITAVVGTMGVVGAVLLVLYVGVVASRAFARHADRTTHAAAWTAIFGMMSPCLGASSPDLGFIFAAYAGFALRPLMAHAAERQPQDGAAGRIDIRALSEATARLGV